MDFGIPVLLSGSVRGVPHRCRRGVVRVSLEDAPLQLYWDLLGSMAGLDCEVRGPQRDQFPYQPAHGHWCPDGLVEPLVWNQIKCRGHGQVTLIHLRLFDDQGVDQQRIKAASPPPPHRLGALVGEGLYYRCGLTVSISARVAVRSLYVAQPEGRETVQSWCLPSLRALDQASSLHLLG